MLSFDFIAEDEKISKEKESLFEKNELKEESSVVSQCDLSLTLKTNIHNLSLRNIENWMFLDERLSRFFRRM